MSLLPKTKEDFKKSEFWNRFFTKRSKAFEWYGEYRELCEHLHKYIRPKDNILVIGCGNSSLSSDLYDVGLTQITNIDISKIVIKQMTRTNSERSEMKFLHMDVTKMDFKDNEFSVVLDKGTLDALMADDTPETLTKVNEMFAEIGRVLRIGGRYICISLLQEHIIKHILTYFKNIGWMFRVIRCVNAELTPASRGEVGLPVFMIVCTKMNPLPIPIVEICFSGEKIQRVNDETVFCEIKAMQETALICSGLSKTKLVDSDEVSLDLYPTDNDVPRFTVTIVDQPPKRNQPPFAVFIVPQGRETEWLFSTREGRQKLLAEAHFDRLAVVTMHRGQRYGDLTTVQNELNPSIKLLTPPTYNDQKIPYLSLGDDLGKREVIHQGTSDYCGGYIVEDIYKAPDDIYRRLIFLNNQSLVQSEAKMVTNSKQGLKVDYGYLGCDHHKFMSVGVQMVSNGLVNSQVLIIGLGGGGLCSFLQSCQDCIKVKAIDIDPEMLVVAQKWFGLNLNKKLTVEITDGLKYLENCSPDTKYDAILIDVNSEDESSPMSCPPQGFVEEKFLNVIKRSLAKNGILVLNMVCKVPTLRNDILNRLLKVFGYVATYKLEEDQNEIIYCSNRKVDWEVKLKNASINLNKYCTKIQLCTDDVINVNEFVNLLKVHTRGS